jgi:hypothetical protein
MADISRFLFLFTDLIIQLFTSNTKGVSQKLKQTSRVRSSHENRKGHIYLCLEMISILLQFKDLFNKKYFYYLTLYL